MNGMGVNKLILRPLLAENDDGRGDDDAAADDDDGNDVGGLELVGCRSVVGPRSSSSGSRE